MGISNEFFFFDCCNLTPEQVVRVTNDSSVALKPEESLTSTAGNPLPKLLAPPSLEEAKLNPSVRIVNLLCQCSSYFSCSNCLVYIFYIAAGFLNNRIQGFSDLKRRRSLLSSLLCTTGLPLTWTKYMSRACIQYEWLKYQFPIKQRMCDHIVTCTYSELSLPD